MKLRYFSDVHLEFLKLADLNRLFQAIGPPTEEVCILAGDIGNPYQETYDVFMKFISKTFIKTFVIPGNHEYYNKSKTVEETNAFMEEYFKQFDNISFLNNRCEQYGGYCFIGTTLWSTVTQPQYKINDVYKIPKMDATRYNALNASCIAFLKGALEANENCIVITHHMPSASLIDVKYMTGTMIPYNQWFYCNMDAVAQANAGKIRGWFYGHTHTASQAVLHGVPFLCNPIGYPDENDTVDFQATFRTDEAHCSPA